MLKKIIIIDDDTEDIEFMKESVQALGDYECKTFLDACEALEYLNSDVSIPELIIIDINMPRMDGQECLREIRKIAKLQPSLVAIYSSALATNEILANIERSEAVFFQKPSTYDGLNKLFKDLIYQNSNRSKKLDI